MYRVYVLLDLKKAVAAASVPSDKESDEQMRDLNL